MITPKKTIELLNELEEAGISNEQFRIVHFKPGETIDSHRNYCESLVTNTFNEGSRNAVVCRRLCFMAKYKHFIHNPELFTLLANIAASEINMPTD